MKSSLITILFIFLCLFAYTKLFGPIPFSVNSVTTTKSDLFRVDGTGEATAIPYTALLSLGVTKTASTVENAQNQTNTVAQAVIKELKALGIEEKNIKTTNYSVNPEYNFTNGQQTVKGYSVTQNLEVKIQPVETAQIAVDAATKRGANLVGNIQFVLNDETREKLEDEARKEAVGKAKKKAQSLASAAGIRLGKIIDVQEMSSPRYSPYAVQSLEAKDGATNVPTQLTPGENKVVITISISYEMY